MMRSLTVRGKTRWENRESRNRLAQGVRVRNENLGVDPIGRLRVRRA
jgi:hypothetical protein